MFPSFLAPPPLVVSSLGIDLRRRAIAKSMVGPIVPVEEEGRPTYSSLSGHHSAPDRGPLARKAPPYQRAE
jgi:hypothetical protein